MGVLIWQLKGEDEEEGPGPTRRGAQGRRPIHHRPQANRNNACTRTYYVWQKAQLPPITSRPHCLLGQGSWYEYNDGEMVRVHRVVVVGRVRTRS